MSKLKQRLEASKGSRRYFETKFMLEVTDALADCLEESNIKKKDLADKLGLTKGRVSQFFCGEKNLTLRTLASILWASGKRGRLIIEDVDHEPANFHLLDECFLTASPGSAYTFDFESEYSESTLSA